MGQQEIFEHEAPGEYRPDAGFNSWLTAFYQGCKLIREKSLTLPFFYSFLNLRNLLYLIKGQVQYATPHGGHAVIMRRHRRPYGFASLPFGKFALSLFLAYLIFFA